MISRPQITAEYAGPYGLPMVFIATLAMLVFTGPVLLAQNKAGPAGAADLKIEVLDVTTGSGSKTQAPDKPPLQIEATPGSKAAPSKVPADPRHASLTAALDRWHYDTLASYNYNISALVDPFMPIQEVRGQPEVKIDPNDWAQRTPIEKLELNQLKLVAITSLSDRQGGAWASFEDGANNSYILSTGSKIGRNHGRITRIAPNEVWVEERGSSGKEPPKTTVIRMNLLDTRGMTREAGAEDTGALQTLSVPRK